VVAPLFFIFFSKLARVGGTITCLAIADCNHLQGRWAQRGAEVTTDMVQLGRGCW